VPLLPSLRARLFAFLLALAAVTALAVGGATYFSVRAEADKLFDYHLQQIALSLRDQGEIPEDERAALANPEFDYVVQVWSSRGVALYTSRPPGLLEPLPPRAVLARFRSASRCRCGSAWPPRPRCAACCRSPQRCRWWRSGCGGCWACRWRRCSAWPGRPARATDAAAEIGREVGLVEHALGACEHRVGHGCPASPRGDSRKRGAGRDRSGTRKGKVCRARAQSRRGALLRSYDASRSPRLGVLRHTCRPSD
jgi:hypothetical protein